jgi:sugar (pentulose or hexulose) kinase
MDADLIAVIDIGKTNARLFVVDRSSGEIVWRRQRENEVIAASPLKQLDILGVETWLVQALAAAPRKESIGRIVPVAHGAAAVLVDDKGEIVAAPDYEDAAFDATREAYARVRDPFECTFSPRLPSGLNLGAQLYFLEVEHARLFKRARRILLLPQFFAWRLSGVMASEITSLGCHSDLWRPLEDDFSLLAREHGYADRLPPLRRAWDVLGPVRSSIAGATGLDPGCEVLCGIHDSSASYLAHLCGRTDDSPFAVVSSGTWTIAMASGVDLHRLRPERDMLANIDALGSPVATARFMGGREYLAVGGESALESVPTPASLKRVIDRRAMALPSFATGCGPFPHSAGTLLRAQGLEPAARAALATLYVALVVDVMLNTLDARGDVVVDGPLVRNPLFAPILAAFRPASRVQVADMASGAVSGGLALARGMRRDAAGDDRNSAVESLAIDGLQAHRAEWRERVSA